jgi:hypothetical protein
MDSTVTNMADELARRDAARRERELRGAWRAGYDYLNVYNPAISTAPLGNNGSLSERFVMQEATFIPSDRPHSHADYAYNIGAVPDDLLRRAIDGELSTAEVGGGAE